MHTFGTVVDVGCSFLLDLAQNFCFDLFQMLRMFFNLQAMLFFEVFEGIGINPLDQFIGLSQ